MARRRKTKMKRSMLCWKFLGEEQLGTDAYLEVSSERFSSQAGQIMFDKRRPSSSHTQVITSFSSSNHSLLPIADVVVCLIRFIRLVSPPPPSVPSVTSCRRCVS
ncbi:hypothetical protein KIN20_028693 [Parelaphostrongylus tenuis]|uniref:Uncharacterized protein n=1 Tax=Parelaphostrongylus tenuis TaxID=148309 RepID=A0AAD5R158_PARTN|nr:hypothetical protein KIN20_028693 [Parelaphostrongylus tenuis]